MQKTRVFHYSSVHHPEIFWHGEAGRIHWDVEPETILDFSRPPFARWFVGGRTNLCFNAVDRWLPQQADRQALIWVSTEVDQERIYTRTQLFEEVNAAAAMPTMESRTLVTARRDREGPFCTRRANDRKRSRTISTTPPGRARSARGWRAFSGRPNCRRRARGIAIWLHSW